MGDSKGGLTEYQVIRMDVLRLSIALRRIAMETGRDTLRVDTLMFARAVLDARSIETLLRLAQEMRELLKIVLHSQMDQMDYERDPAVNEAYEHALKTVT